MAPLFSAGLFVVFICACGQRVPSYTAQMKRVLSGLCLFVSFAVSGASAADQLGVVGSFQTGALMFGAQYQQDNGVRVGLGYGRLLPVVEDAAAAADVSYLMPLPPQLQGYVQPYYGFGLGMALAFPARGVRLGLFPNVLAGVNFANATPFTPFVEAAVGPGISLGSVTGLDLSFGLRAGVNYRLP